MSKRFNILFNELSMRYLFEEKKQVLYILTLVVCVTVGPVKSVTCLYSRLGSFCIVFGGVF
jgi:hypothetical protein